MSNEVADTAQFDVVSRRQQLSQAAPVVHANQWILITVHDGSRSVDAAKTLWPMPGHDRPHLVDPTASWRNPLCDLLA